ncbi:MAG: hydroxymethylbilane synthase [Gammaproteobacteria bacterium]|nr:hydroxymethylbilane synthase [Gammaproteobacteria bacterium]MBT5202780.1 hydroxymethylbilane synthase [Gammaproteobacteria bacterium]MBT5603076.1 hydroxymethylbilane synthase [Gammaproteobacteria bacterium]
MRKIRIVTRKSTLAMWQANFVKQQIKQAFAQTEVEILGLSTQGDRDRNSSLSQLGGKGVFVKELENALLQGAGDIAVHSMKDVPSELPEGLGITAICSRAEPSDALISNGNLSFADMSDGAVIGSSSLRRRFQLQHRYPGLVFKELRGNVDTRLRRLDEGHFDGIILATAGLQRLGLGHRICLEIPAEDCVPSAGQGAVGIESLIDRQDLSPILTALNDPSSFELVSCERRISELLGANCSLPVAAFASYAEGGTKIQLNTFVSSEDGQIQLRLGDSAPLGQGGLLAERVAQAMIDQGALQLIQAD